MDVDSFDYHLPDRAIAQIPVEPRHDARLLDSRDLSDHLFLDLSELLDPADVVVVNSTRVRRARLPGAKHPTGGSVEVLILSRGSDGRWEALIRPARRIHAGTRLKLGGLGVRVETEPDEGRVVLFFDAAPDEVEAMIETHGRPPLPPYITRDLADPERYQTMFADRRGSAAAPTAGLHFTPAVVERMAERDIPVLGVDLEVGLGTFRPINVSHVEQHQMHQEAFRIPDATVDAIGDCRRRGGRVVAVGTTVVRALESSAKGRSGVQPGEAVTDLFIVPGYRFQVVDLLVTNFHLPRSSLLVMLEAFMGPEWRRVYGAALDRGYRFLSFGDAMLAERR